MDGDTLTVTFNRNLDTSVDTAALLYHLSVQGVGGAGGGRRYAYHHPSHASVSGQTLTLTLGVAARADDTVTLTYEFLGDDKPLKDTNNKTAPPFRDLAVTNNTAGTIGPAPVYASVKGTELRLRFDRRLDPRGTSGTAFRVKASDLDDDTRTILGTGTAIARQQINVYVELEHPVRPGELASVSYEIPSENPLQGAGGNKVKAFEHFGVERVLDGIPPEFAGAGAVQWVFGSSPESLVVVYFDEPLDTNSVPATGDFSVLVDGNVATVSSVAVEGDAVRLTLGTALPGGTGVSMGYNPGTNPIRDLAGNPVVETFAHLITAASPAAPTLTTSGADAPAVDGAHLTLNYDTWLNPAKVPGPDRFTLHYPLLSGETNRTNTLSASPRSRCGPRRWCWRCPARCDPATWRPR